MSSRGLSVNVLNFSTNVSYIRLPVDFPMSLTNRSVWYSRWCSIMEPVVRLWICMLAGFWRGHQNTAPWNMECFMLKEFRKGQVQEDILMSSQIRSQKPNVRIVLPRCRAKEHPYLWSWRDTEGNLNEHEPLPPQAFSNLLSCSILFFHNSSLFVKRSISILQFNHFFQVFIFLWRLLCDVKLLLNNSVCFFLVLNYHLLQSSCWKSRKTEEQYFFLPL